LLGSVICYFLIAVIVLLPAGCGLSSFSFEARCRPREALRFRLLALVALGIHPPVFASGRSFCALN
jgi:hypothetical protein